MKITDHNTGKAYGPEHPDFDKIRIGNLENTVRDLVRAVGDLQHRLSAVDNEPLPWPASAYEPSGS